MILDGVARQLASQAKADEDDLQFAREASAYHLKLSEAVLRETPDNLALAEAVSAGFTQYAYAFVAFEAERMEATDARRAHKERQRAARFYGRAQTHAMQVLRRRHADLDRLLNAAQSPAGSPLKDDEVGVAYWAAAAWGARIASMPDDAAALAELPQAARLAQWAWQRRPAFGDGALASLMGSFENARPGGSGETARQYFDRAIELGAGRNAGVFVAKAEGVALPAGDRALFESLLRQAIAVRDAHRNLNNEALAERAQWLLDTAEDRF